MLHKLSIKQKLLKGGGWAFSGKVVGVLAGLAVNALLVRLLTQEEMGAYFLTFSLVSFAAIVAQLGLTQTIVRLVAESMGSGRTGRTRQSVIVVLRITAVSVLIVACFLVFGVGQGIAERFFSSLIMSQAMGLAAVWTAIVTFQQLMAEIYRGFHDIRLATIFGGLSTSVFSMLLFIVLWLVQGHADIAQIIFLTLVAGAGSILISSAILWDKLNTLVPASSEDETFSFLDVLFASWPIWITHVTVFVLIQADLWIMGLFRSSEEVAIYGASSRLVALVTMPLLIINAVVPPLIAEMYAQNKIRELENILRAVSTLSVLPSLIALAVFIFFGDSILGFLFGSFYKTGGIIIIILSVGQLANIWAGSSGVVLIFTGYQFEMMLITILSGVLMIAMGWWLVGDYGAVGVASAACGGMFLQNILMLLTAKWKAGIWTHVNPRLINDMSLFSRYKNNK